MCSPSQTKFVYLLLYLYFNKGLKSLSQIKMLIIMLHCQMNNHDNDYINHKTIKNIFLKIKISSIDQLSDKWQMAELSILNLYQYNMNW